MKKLLLIFIFIFVLYSRENGERQVRYSKYMQIMMNLKDRGSFVSFYDNGSVKYITSYNNSHLKNGKHYEFDVYGNLKKVITYIKGIRSGVYLEYFSSTKKLKSRGLYINGKLEKVYYRYNEDGKNYMKINYENGIPLSGTILVTDNSFRPLSNIELKNILNGSL